MNIRLFLTLLLAVNVSTAVVCNWTVWNRALVIINAIALLGTILAKVLRKE